MKGDEMENPCTYLMLLWHGRLYDTHGIPQLCPFRSHVRLHGYVDAWVSLNADSMFCLQRMTPLQALQMQLQLQQQLGRQQQQMAGQQNFGSNAGNAGNIGGLERFFQNAAQRPTMPAQV